MNEQMDMQMDEQVKKTGNQAERETHWERMDRQTNRIIQTDRMNE